MNTVAANLEALIAEGSAIKARMGRDEARLAEIQSQVLMLGPGKYSGADGTSCQVIAPAPRIKLDKDAEESVREITGPENFKKMFDRIVSFKPKNGFRAILEAVISGKRDQNAILALTEHPSTPYVKWG